ncbi:unnamed protein product [Cyprideis torosa]|uniref:Uncharacterized protein n=1 Tax=Cyprideis torosa TaxID=163714 RepID=A0A7R8ZI17_9CRUS|nr:unnamed protein product [Cyprideis torosa]CAG0879081.1 unnamed protein product [Cyprideis torosa]
MKDEKLELKFCESPCSSSSNTFEVKRTRKQRSESNSFKEGSEECDFKARETCTRVYICHRMESSGEEHSEEIEEKSQTLSTPETIIGESPSRTNDREPGSHGTSTTSDGKDMVTLLSPRFLKSLGDLEHLLKPTYQHHDISQESTSITVFEESTAVPLKDTDARVSVSNSARSGTLASLECHNSVHISGLELEPNSFVRILEREESVGTELEMFETVQKPYYCDDLKPIFVEGVPIMTCSFPFLECTVPESEFSLATEYRQAQVINAAIGFKNGLCVMGLPIEDLTKNILATSNVFEGPPSYDSDALIFCWKSTRPLPGDDDDLTKYFQLPGMHEVNVSDSFQNPDLTFRLHSETKPIQHFKPHHEDRQCFQSFHRIIHQVPTTQEDNFCSTLTEKIEDKNERVHIEEGNLRRTAPHSSKIRQCQNVVVREDSMIDVHALTEVNHSQGTKRSGIHTQTYQEDVNSSRETTTQKQEEGVSVPKEEIIEDNGYNECSRKSKLTKHKEPKDSEENYKTSESRTNTASKSSKGSYSTKCSSSKSKHVSDESSKGDEQPAAFEQEHFLRTRIAHHDEMQLRYQEIRKHPGQTHTMKRIHPCQYEIGKTIHRDIDSESFHPRDLEVENQIPGNEHIERDNVKISMIRPSFDHSDQSSHTEQGTVEHNQQPNEKQRFQEHARHHRKMENEHHEREPRDMQNWDQSHFTMQEHTPREATEPSNTDIGLDALFTCEKPLSRQNNVEHQREDSVSKQKSTTSIHNEVGDSKAHEHMREKEKTIFQYDMEYCQLQTKKSMLHQKEAESHEVSAHQVRQTNFQFEYEKHEHEYYGHEVKTGEQGDQPQVVIETVRETCLLVEAEKVVHTEQRTSDQTLLQCAVQDQETWTVKILETRDERGEVIPQQSGFEPELPETSRERGPTSESEIPEKIQTNEQSETSVSSREIQENVCMKSGDAGSGTEVMDQTPVWIQNTKDSYLKEGQKNVSDHERSHCTKSFQGSSSEFGTNITTYSDPTDPEDDMNLLHSKDRGGEWLTMVLEEESNNEDETESMAQGNDLTSGGKEHIVVEVSASMREVETDNRMESSGSTSEGIGESDMNLIMAQVRLLRNHISSVTGEFMMPPIAEHPNSISFVEGETSGSDLNQEGECEESLEENEEEVSEEVIISADNDDPDQNADLSEVQGEHEREMSTPELLQEAFSIDEVPMGHFLQNTPQRRQTYSDALSAQIDDTRQQELTTKKLRNTKSTMTNQSNRKEPERADGVGALNPSQQEANPNLRESVHGAGEIQSERASQSMDLCSSEQSAGDLLFSDSLLLAPERNGSYPSMCSDSKIFFHRTPQHTENNLASEYNKTDNRTVTRTDIFGKSAIGASYPERVEDVTTSDGKVGPQTITVTEVTGRKTMMTSLWHFQSVKSPAHANEFEGEREEAAITNDTELVSGNDRFKTYQHRSNQKRIVRSSVHSSKKANLESFQLSELPSLFDRTEEEFRSTPFHQLELTSSTATSELHLSSISSNDSASNEFTENIQTTDLMIEVDELGSPSSPEPREPRVNTKKNTETMLDNPSSLRLVLEEFSIEMESEDDESIGSQERNQKLKQRQNQVVLEIDALSFRDESEQASREKSSNRSSSMSKSAAA